ncbi:MAG: hypothetical protein HT580_06705 [Dechloromonas sp.]|nr:MAG: hypothetical protein HT580_06705 [Dechloromonas sp.]
MAAAIEFKGANVFAGLRESSQNRRFGHMFEVAPSYQKAVAEDFGFANLPLALLARQTSSARNFQCFPMRMHHDWQYARPVI